MDLPNIFSQSTEMDVRVLICSIVTDTTIQSLLLKVTAEGTKVLTRSSVIVYSSPEMAAIKLDETLQDLGPESEKITDVIFALDPAWLQQGDVVAAKKPILHKMVHDLSLRPIGFVVLSEAIVQHSTAHNPHFSAVLLLVGAQSLALTVTTQGVTGATQMVGRSADMVADIREACARYLQAQHATHLPGKIVCASLALTEEELTLLQQKLLEATWGSTIPFVQAPTIDIIKPELALSIIAQQAGEAIAALQKPVTTSHKATQVHDGNQVVAPASPQSDSFDFTPVPATTLQARTQERAVEVERTSLPTSFGIPIQHSKALHAEESRNEGEELAVELPDDARVVPQRGWKKTLNKLLDNSGKYNVKAFVIAGFIAGIAALILIGWAWLYFLSTVTIGYAPVPKTIASEVTLTLDPDATAPDAEKRIIPGKRVTIDGTETVEGTTTGIKIVGEKAKGQITLYNKTQTQKTFPAGTVVAQDSLQFVTDAEVTVPAATAKEEGNTMTTTFGEATVGITAYVIGAEGNLAKDTELAVSNFDKSTYTAKVLEGLAGGTSREMRVVSKEDRELLLSEAKKAAETKAAAEFKERSGNGTYILPNLELVITKATYSAEIEAPSESLTLELLTTVSALSYSIDDLRPIAEAVLASQVPAGYTVSDQDPEILSAPATTSNTTKAVVLEANISAKVIPLIDTVALRSEVVGMSSEKAREHLIGKSTVKDVTITFNPSLAEKVVTRLPTSTDRIIVSEKKSE